MSVSVLVLKLVLVLVLVLVRCSLVGGWLGLLAPHRPSRLRENRWNGHDRRLRASHRARTPANRSHN